MTLSFKNILIAIIIFTTFLLIVGGYGKGKDPSVCDYSHAPIESIVWVKSILKSPSTAQFPSTYEFKVSTISGDMRVEGYVDAQNGFGAMLRSPWVVSCSCDKGTWTLLSLEFDGKKVY